ncbi:sphingomyelin phosphodiesterase [Leptospira interrogans]|uniref:sphingomyelin phosphodiesterase n=1 Tax=Leptospira interrogans TaxID=173 RepID=UPI0010BF757A|nr:sphingomyelin phosphodiesterase [Leptospira interrogans]KAA1269448.1 sphingomyelin phosphodiesterase [Leptospira interrogans serovar Weerasinghe]QCO34019.1 sphingomyelin phosphodiesterase [Leptospira interrogans]ULG80601.1 sphingomyelin phosphodiesterase [Leptospira interrogans]UML68226.1 sphingomyelin phosphodiesterase [Leptospira interrogans]UML71549.1 sphingomyelin phosphodiesterase [Leptospira interrogans]
MINKITKSKLLIGYYLLLFSLIRCLPEKESSYKDLFTSLLFLPNQTNSNQVNSVSINNDPANPNPVNPASANNNQVNAVPENDDPANLNPVNPASANSNQVNAAPANKYFTKEDSSNNIPKNVEIKVLSHNVFMLPTNLPRWGNWGHDERAKQISKSDYVKNQDVIVFEEAFDTSARKILLDNLQEEYPYQTDVVGRTKKNWDASLGNFRSYSLVNGGVVILSKWPIEEKIQYIFNDSGCGADWFANKGFVYVKINKEGKKFHVIGTHTQSQDQNCSNRGVPNRVNQFDDIRNFIYSKNIPKDETVLIVGDLNVIKGSNEYYDMISRLNVNEPRYVGVPFTWDAKTNEIAAYYYENEESVYLDYIFVSKSHAQPPVWQNLAYDPVSKQTWTVSGYTSDEFSDHYPIYGFVYADPSTPTTSGHKKKYDQVSFQSAANSKYIQADPNRKNGWLKADAVIETDFTKFNLLQEGNLNPSCIKNGLVRIESSRFLNYFWNWWLGGGSGNYGYYSKFNDASNQLEIINLSDGCLENGSKIVFKDYDTYSRNHYYLTVWDKGNWNEHLYLWKDSISQREIFYLKLNSTPVRNWGADLIYR